MKQSYKNQRHGDIFRDIELQKQYKPIVKPLQELVEVSKHKQPLKPIEPPPKSLEKPLKPTELPQNVKVVLQKQKYWRTKDQRNEMGPIAIKYLNKYCNNKNFKKYERDETYSVTDKFIQQVNVPLEGHLYTGDCHISSNGDNISIDDGKKWYEGTEGLWELLTNHASKIIMLKTKIITVK